MRVVRWLTLAALALALIASVAPAATPSAGATTCPEGYVLGPDKEVVNSDGSVTRTPGDCIPAKTLNIPGGLLGNLETDQTPQIDLEQAQDVDIGSLPETPTPTPEAENNGEAGNDGIGLGNVTAQEVPILEVTGTGYLTIHKYHCEGAVDWAASSLEDLRSGCSGLADIQFDLSNVVADGSKSYQQIATSDSDGLAFWQIPNPATILVDEVMPEGYVDPIVYCGVVSGPGSGLGQLLLTDSAGGVITQPLQNDQQMYCDWFNVAGTATADDGEGGELIVQKFVCPPGEYGNAQELEQIGASIIRRQGDDTPENDPDLCTEFEAETGVGFTFNLTVNGQDLGLKTTDDTGIVKWTGFGTGELVITEQVPEGYGDPYFYCSFGRAPVFEGFAGSATITYPFPDAALGCVVVNVPEGEPLDGGVVVYKWECDEDPSFNTDMPAHLEAQGCKPVDGVNFNLSYGIDSSLSKTTGDSGAGSVEWSDIPAGTISITELIPDGYGDPVVYCFPGIIGENGPLTVITPDATGGVISHKFMENEFLRCYWINIPYEDGSITINKYTCPEGYDLYADGADPYVDCPDLTDGIEFKLYHNDTFVDSQMTGSSGNGQVQWGSLEAGYYYVKETVPANIADVFVLECTGANEEWIQNWPLSESNEFEFQLTAGTHLVCNWYNVPEPEWGTVTVIKYACVTEHFVSPEQCEIYEGGVQFQLFHWTGAEGYVAGEGTTNASGVLTWTGLPDGYYELSEIDREWCYAEASRSDANGNIEVAAGEETTVWVYNCGVKTPLKQPVKYPNTGIGGAMVSTDVSAAPVESQGSYLALPHNRLAGVLDSRIASSMTAGGRPVQIAIDSIGLAADIEVLEVVDGTFEDPTTSDMVAWYKDTASPGEPGNVMMAGHLNYWGDPEGVFFALADVREGDIIGVMSQDGAVHQYEVTSIRQVEATAETLETVAAQTGEQTLTLITCGGQWDPGIQSYLHRTVVKAIQID
jgi:LPXTG-site transpeptidase (sortase) family protein